MKTLADKHIVAIEKKQNRIEKLKGEIADLQKTHLQEVINSTGFPDAASLIAALIPSINHKSMHLNGHPLKNAVLSLKDFEPRKEAKVRKTKAEKPTAIKRGRPSSVSPELREKIIAAIKDKSSNESNGDISRRFGITEPVFYNIKKHAKL